MSAERSSRHLQNKHIIFHFGKEIATCINMATGYVKYHLISHVELIWWEMLADIHTGRAALHMLACWPRNLHAICWGSLTVPLHLWHISSPLTLSEGHQCVCPSSQTIKKSTPARINQMATGPTPYKPGSFQVMRTLTFKSSSSRVCVLQPPYKVVTLCLW